MEVVMTIAFALTVIVLLGATPLTAPDSVVVPMWADTSVEIEAVVFPPTDFVLPLNYQISWGDGETLDWTEPLRSPIDISRYHTYGTPGGYMVSVRARDSLGRISAWGRPHGILVQSEPIQKGVFPTSDPIVASPSLDLHGNIYVGDESGSFYSINSVTGQQRWVFKANDAIYGAAAIAGTRIYFGSLDSNVYCLDTLGKKRWSLYVGDEVYCTPAIGADGTIYIGTDKGTLTAITPKGKRKWKYQTGDDIAGSPTIGPQGNVYITADSVYCIDPRGRRRWAFGAPEGEYFFASAMVDKDGAVYAGNNDGYLYCLDTDGRQQWRAPVPDGDEIRPEAVFGPESSLYFGTDGDYLCRKTPDGTPTVLYEANDIVVSAAAASANGTVFVLPDDGTLVAVAANGRVLWKRDVASGGKEVYYTSSPTIGPDGTVYVGSWDGGLYAFRGDGPAAKTPWPMYRHDAQHTGRQTR
jgi:outer membrane protein assembly factor BamB